VVGLLILLEMAIKIFGEVFEKEPGKYLLAFNVCDWLSDLDGIFSYISHYGSG